MNPFWETLSVTGAVAAVIVAVIITLTLFFRGLAWISGAGAKPEALAVRGVLKKNTLATVHLVGGETFENIRFIGFTSTESVKSHLPLELNGMVILENEQQQRILVRAKDIRRIVVPPAAD